MTLPKGWSSPDVDPRMPSSGRIYDYILGGFTNFESDRILTDQIREEMPEVVDGARAGRAFLRRAITFLATESGITQFLDLGSGIPAVGSAYDVARAYVPAARIACVDVDPVIVTLGRKMFADNPSATMVCADFLDPDTVLADPDIVGLIDFTRPVAVVMSSVLHFIPDEANPAEVIARIHERVVPGSALVVSHFIDDGPGGKAERLAVMTADMARHALARTPEQVEDLCSGFAFVDPGMVDVAYWRPEVDPATIPPSGWCGGVARRV